MTARYPVGVRALHWLMAAVIVAMLAAGFMMLGIPKNDSARHLYYGLHKSFGITLALLVVLRIGLRLATPAPPLPAVIPLVQRKLIGFFHVGLYGLMVAMPCSGYVMSVSNGQPLKWFGLAVPRLLGEDKAVGATAGDVHAMGAYALIGLVALHVGGVLWHHLVDRVKLMHRMV